MTDRRTPSELVRDSTGPKPTDGPRYTPETDDERIAAVVRARLFPSLATPVRIGRYTVLDKLGQGGMGIVYAAFDSELDRRVAIKLLRAHSVGAQGEARLLREAKAMARVAHPNVISVIEVGRHEGSTYVVMEYLRGRTLNDWLADSPGWRAALAVYVQAGRGLAAAHRAGVIHRDFKPHNVMMIEGGVDDGRVKVLDFGLARADADASARGEPGAPAGAGALEALTRTGALVGTPLYMAPEQYAGMDADERSDQYSFAVSLYEALFGERPYTAESLDELARVIQAGAQPRPSARDVPPWLRRVVLRGLERDPAARHGSMDDLVAALEADPSARRRRLVVGVGLVAGTFATAWALARVDAETSTPCEGPEFRLDGIWDEHRAGALQEAFAASSRAYALDTAARARSRLDDYAVDWSEMRREACVSHQRGVQSAATLDLRMRCLERRRAGLSALVELLLEADEATITKAVEATTKLDRLARCADVDALSAARPLPADPERAAAVLASRRALTRARVLESAGRYEEALQVATGEQTTAATLDYPPLTTEAALVVGVSHQGLFHGDEADRALSAAFSSGIIARADRFATEALARRLFVRGVILSDPTRALADEELAVALTERLADGDLQWLALNNLGAVLIGEGEGARARARSLFQRARALEDGPSELERAYTLANLGVLEAEGGARAAAVAAFGEARVEFERALGPHHPLLAQILTNEAIALSKHGQRQRARQRHERAVKIYEGAGMGDNAVVVQPLVMSSALALRRRHYDEARALAERAREVAEDEKTGYPLARAHARAAEAEALFGVGRVDESRAAFESLTRFIESSFAANHAVLVAFYTRIAEGALARRDYDEAITLLTRARAVRPKDQAPVPGEQLELLVGLGRAYLGRGDPARGDLERALSEARAARELGAAHFGRETVDFGEAARLVAAVHGARGARREAGVAYREALRALEARLDADDPELARLRLDAAKNMMIETGENQPRALELAARARDGFASLGPAFADERADAARWLEATTEETAETEAPGGT